AGVATRRQLGTHAWRLGADRGVIPVAGVHDRAVGEREQSGADAGDGRWAGGSRRSRMLRRIVGRSENERPVAPGPPLNSVSPEKRTWSPTSWRQQPPGLWPGVWTTARSRPTR